MKIAIYRCREHDLYRLVIENEEGGGQRHLGIKCCIGQYARKICEWVPTGPQWLELARACEDAGAPEDSDGPQV